MAFEQSEKIPGKKVLEGITLPNFHDMLATIYPAIKDEPGKLTQKQKAWIRAYNNLDPADAWRAPCGKVAAILGISLSASSRLRQRISIILKENEKPYLDEMNDKQDDERIEAAYMTLEQNIEAYPEYLEKVRGVSGLVHWKPVEVYHERTGRSYRTGHVGETISEHEAKSLDLPLVKRTKHTPSPGGEWWHNRVLEHCERFGVSYKQGYLKVHGNFYIKWPKEKPHHERFCKVCGCLLPLGERIGEKLIKSNSKYCSDRCKTYSKRK